MKRLLDWWHTSCERCIAIRKTIIEAAQLVASLLAIMLLLCSSLFLYWIFFDNGPAISYGSNSRAEFVGDRVIFHLDATRLRDCPTIIQRKISGCGQIDLPESFASTPIGQQPGPVSFPLDILFKSFTREQLSGNVCTLVSQASSYCNPVQRLLRVPIVAQSSITFVPVPRAKTYLQEETP